MNKKFCLGVLCALLLSACGNESTPNSSEAKTADNATDQAQTSGQLNIYNWSDYVDPETVTAFEKEHNITIRYDYYDSNETLEAKVLTGKSGYDLVVPGAANIGRQIQAGAYQKLDKSQIPNYGNLDPQLMKLMESVDPNNEYAIPYFMGINTVGINVQAVEKALGEPLPENEWDLVFNPKYTAKLKSCGISFLDSPSEVFPLALHYLHLDPNSSKPEDLQAAADMMKAVRPDIKRFSSSGYINDLARGELCAVIGYGGDINIAATRAEEANSPYTVKALVPKVGVGIWIDSFAIPKDAQNLTNAYQYLNYTLDAKVAAQNGNFVTYAPGSKPAKDLMEKKYTENLSIFPSDEDMQRSFILKPFTPDGIKRSVRLWQNIKAGA